MEKPALKRPHTTLATAKEIFVDPLAGKALHNAE